MDANRLAYDWYTLLWWPVACVLRGVEAFLDWLEEVGEVLMWLVV